MIRSEQLLDLTCQDCDKKEWCKSPCIFINKLAGKDKGCKELLPPPEPPDNGQDYKATLIDYQDKKANFRKKTISDIKKLQDTRLKAIAALLYAGFKVSDIPFIVEILNIQRSRLYDIIRDNIKSDS